jgi:hypothetical protein
MKMIIKIFRGVFLVVITVAALTAQSQTTPPVSGYTVLPIKYVVFKASATNKGVDFYWIADNEINKSYFEIERSFDGSHFSSTNIIVAGADNTFTNTYRANDNENTLSKKTVVYYRLKQVDISGSATFSKIEIVRLPMKSGSITLAYPNPFTDVINIIFTSGQSGCGMIEIQNATGKTVLTKKVNICKGQNHFYADGTASFTKGIYFVRLAIDGGTKENYKIIKA